MGKWTPDQEADLRRLVRAEDADGEPKYSYSEIGDHFGVSRNAAIGKAQRLGIAGMRGSPIQLPLTPWEREKVRRRHLFANLDPSLLLGTLGPFDHQPPPDYIAPASACQYPTGDDLPFTFCEAETKPGTSWCPFHYSKTHIRKN